jgi:hypothetical protein
MEIKLLQVQLLRGCYMSLHVNILYILTDCGAKSWEKTEAKIPIVSQAVWFVFRWHDKSMKDNFKINNIILDEVLFIDNQVLISDTEDRFQKAIHLLEVEKTYNLIQNHGIWREMWSEVQNNIKWNNTRRTNSKS